MTGALAISLLGPPSVWRDGEPVAFDTGKAVALLAHLALTDRPRSRAVLCELLWPGRDSEHSRAALRRTLSVLRKGLGEEWLETAGDTVALRDGPALSVDLWRFRSLAGSKASTDDLLAAVGLFRGEFLEGFGLRDSPEFDHWCASESDLLRRELSATLARLVALLTERREYEAAIRHARRWLELDPLHEPAHRELIRLYGLNGDRGAAVSQYRECVRTLSRELGVAPLDETAALFEQVSEGVVVAPAPPALPGAGISHPGAVRQLPLVGRSRELDALLAAHRNASPDGRLAVIEGEAGIGKSRLARELIAVVEQNGGRAFAASAHEDEAGLPYGPIVELLKDAAAAAGAGLSASVPPYQLTDASLLVPELSPPATRPPKAAKLAGPAARTRLFEAIAAVLTAAGEAQCPGIVFVDDVHLADEVTLDVLSYFGRRLRGRAVLLLLAWRSEGVQPGHRLRRLTAELARSGATTVVALGRLTEHDVSVLVQSGQPAAARELGRRVYIDSEGLPLFVAEYLAALAAGRQPADLLSGEIRDLLAARVAGLGAIAQQLLEAAATVGRSFDLDTVRLASGRGDEETAEGLEELVRHGLVRERAVEDPAYDFIHEKLRAVVYDDIGRARRRLLHRRVADAFLREPRRPDAAALAAQHLHLAGDQSAAAEQHVRAAEHAANVLAHRDALEHLDAALALGYADTARLRERIGDLQTLLGDYGGALSSYEAAAAECHPDALARIEQKLGGVFQRRGDWARAEARLSVALEAAREQDAGLRARILADLSLTSHNAGRDDQARELAEAAQILAKDAGDELAQAQAHNLLGVLARERGDLAGAGRELKRSLTLAEGVPEIMARTAALNNLALLARQEGEVERARELTEEALSLCAAWGDRHRQAALLNNLADLYHEAGRDEQAMTHLKRAVTMFAEIGASESTRLPEVWKLVSW